MLPPLIVGSAAFPIDPDERPRCLARQPSLSLLFALFGRLYCARLTLAVALALALLGCLPSARLALACALSLAPSFDGALIFGAAGLRHVTARGRMPARVE